MRRIDPTSRQSTGSCLLVQSYRILCSEERGDVRGWWFSKADAQFSSRDVTELSTGFDESVDYVLKVSLSVDGVRYFE